MTGGDREYDPLYDPLPEEYYARGTRNDDRYDEYGQPREASGGPEQYGAAEDGRSAPAGRHEYRAAVEAMNDPLTDPFPGAAEDGEQAQASPWFAAGRPSPGGPAGPAGGAGARPGGNQNFDGYGPDASAYGRPGPEAYGRPPGNTGAQGPPGAPVRGHVPGVPAPRPHDAGPPGGVPQQAPPGAAYGPGGLPHSPGPAERPAGPQSVWDGLSGPRSDNPPERGPAGPGRPGRPGADAGETAAMPAVDDPSGDRGRTLSVDADGDDRTMALRTDDDPVLAGGGRAARRKAARGHARGADAAEESAAAPTSRLEARRAARAAKDGPVVLVSRFIGEMFITCGVLMLLFVTYQLWWTNVQAHERADSAANNLVQKWKDHPASKPGAFDPGQGFAIMYIPKLDVRAPIAQGVSKEKILDKGMIGHYDKSSGLPTAMPWDKKGNFALAAHRNTHGEPFRYVNRLVSGDKIIVETADTYYTYEMFSRLPSTSPADTSVIDQVPPKSGLKKPGRYITLTTCTPEFTSRYRLIVWGKMVDERPRSEGKPDALIG